MHPLEQRFAVMYVDGLHISYVTPDGSMSVMIDDAKIFTSMVEGKAFLSAHLQVKQITASEAYAVIPLVNHAVAPRNELKALPPPDFYEVGDSISAETIIGLLTRDSFAVGFTPVDSITGANQMMSGLGTDVHDDRAVARVAKFSFPGWMEKEEIVKLHESATCHKQWKNCRIANRGNGFAKWFIVTLSSDLR